MRAFLAFSATMSGGPSRMIASSSKALATRSRNGPSGRPAYSQAWRRQLSACSLNIMIRTPLAYTGAETATFDPQIFFRGPRVVSLGSHRRSCRQLQRYVVVP
jgi:hypothetical protein